MIFDDYDDYDDVSVDTNTEPREITWEIDDRYALIAFLLMSVDKKPDAACMKKLDSFMGITQAEKNGDEKEKVKLKEIKVLRDSVISECGVFLNSLDRDDSYCDCVMNEIDNIIEGGNDCNIGDGYSYGWLTNEPCELAGGAHFIFDYLKLVLNEGNCSGNQKRLLKHLARKWKINKSVLSIMENSIRALDEINIKRTGLENSDMPYRETVSALSGLDYEEKTVWGKLKEFGITDERAIDAQNFKIGKKFLKPFMPFHPLFKDEDDEDEDDEENDENGVVDKIGDVIVSGICKFGEIVSAPFEWLSGVR